MDPHSVPEQSLSYDDLVSTNQCHESGENTVAPPVQTQPQQKHDWQSELEGSKLWQGLDHDSEKKSSPDLKPAPDKSLPSAEETPKDKAKADGPKKEGNTHDWKRELEESDVWKGRERSVKEKPAQETPKEHTEEPKKIITEPRVKEKSQPEENSGKERIIQPDNEGSKGQGDDKQREKKTEPDKEHSFAGGYLIVGAAIAAVLFDLGLTTYEGYKIATDNVDRFQKAIEDKGIENNTASERVQKAKPENETDKYKAKSEFDKANDLYYREFDKTPELKKLWEECSLGQANTEKGYNNARAKLWRRLNNPQTPEAKYVRDLLERAGFDFQDGTKAPLLKGYGNVPTDTVRLSLDHVNPKALSNDYLSADNIKFILQRDNSQMSHQIQFSH